MLNFSELAVGSMVADETCLIKEVTIRQTKNGKDYVVGVLRNKNSEFSYKSFDNLVVGMFKAGNYTGTLAVIQAEVDSYMNDNYLKILSIVKSSQTDVSEFSPSLDCDNLFKDFVAFIQNNLSEKAIKLLNTVFSMTSGDFKLLDSFKYGYAAKKRHDAIRGGLINHTLKGLNILKSIVSNDSRLKEYSDILYVGWIFTDIGKIKEMENGVYTKNSFVTHIQFSVEIAYACKNLIVEDMGEAWYYRLISCITGHHGNWGDPPNTVWAYILHLVDMLESRVTTIVEAIDNKNYTVMDSGENMISLDDFKLVI